MEHVLIPNESNNEIVKDYIVSFQKKSKQELVDLYNTQVNTGITGVNRQALYLFSLSEVFRQVFGKTPLELRDKNGCIVLGLSTQIKQEGEKFVPINPSIT